MAPKDVWKCEVILWCLVSALSSLSHCTESPGQKSTVSNSMGHIDVKTPVMENTTYVQGEVKMGVNAGRLLLKNNVRPVSTSFAYVDMTLKLRNGTQEADYHADMDWEETEKETDQLSSTDSAAVERLMQMDPKVECNKESMALKVLDPGSSEEFVVDRGDLVTPMPLSQMPPNCGYTMSSSQQGMILTAPYKGCDVIFEEDNYVLPLRWCGLQIRICCPAIQPPSPNFPKMSCYQDGMIVEMESASTDDITVKLKGQWHPLMKVSSWCGYSVVTHPKGVVISTRFAPCVKAKDGMFTLEIAYRGEMKLSCPEESFPKLPVLPVAPDPQYPPPPTNVPQLYHPKPYTQCTKDITEIEYPPDHHFPFFTKTNSHPTKKPKTTPHQIKKPMTAPHQTKKPMTAPHPTKKPSKVHTPKRLSIPFIPPQWSMEYTLSPPTSTQRPHHPTIPPTFMPTKDQADNGKQPSNIFQFYPLPQDPSTHKPSCSHANVFLNEGKEPLPTKKTPTRDPQPCETCTSFPRTVKPTTRRPRKFTLRHPSKPVPPVIHKSSEETGHPEAESIPNCPRVCPAGIPDCCPPVMFHQHHHYFHQVPLGSKENGKIPFMSSGHKPFFEYPSHCAYLPCPIPVSPESTSESNEELTSWRDRFRKTVTDDLRKYKSGIQRSFAAYIPQPPEQPNSHLPTSDPSEPKPDKPTPKHKHPKKPYFVPYNTLMRNQDEHLMANDHQLAKAQPPFWGFDGLESQSPNGDIQNLKSKSSEQSFFEVYSQHSVQQPYDQQSSDSKSSQQSSVSPSEPLVQADKPYDELEDPKLSKSQLLAIHNSDVQPNGTLLEQPHTLLNAPYGKFQTTPRAVDEVSNSSGQYTPADNPQPARAEGLESHSQALELSDSSLPERPKSFQRYWAPIAQDSKDFSKLLRLLIHQRRLTQVLS